MYDMLNLLLVLVGDIVAYRITIISGVLRCIACLTASVSCVSTHWSPECTIYCFDAILTSSCCPSLRTRTEAMTPQDARSEGDSRDSNSSSGSSSVQTAQKECPTLSSATTNT